MNDQSGTAQLRFLEETAIRLRQNGFTVEPMTVTGQPYSFDGTILELCLWQSQNCAFDNSRTVKSTM